LEVLLKGPYLMSREFIQSTLKAGNRGGAIVHTTSIGSYYSVMGFSAYQLGKIALNRLSEFIRLEHEKDGITSIAFHPGGVNTKWWDDIPPNNPLYDLREKIAQDSAALAGGVAVYLTTPHALYLNGRYVGANWDLQELAEKKDEIVSKGLLLMTARGDAVPPPF